MLWYGSPRQLSWGFTGVGMLGSEASTLEHARLPLLMGGAVRVECTVIPSELELNILLRFLNLCC